MPALQAGINYMFRPFRRLVQNNIYQAVAVDQHFQESGLPHGVFGNVKPSGPVCFEHNHWDPLTCVYVGAPGSRRLVRQKRRRDPLDQRSGPRFSINSMSTHYYRRLSAANKP